MLAEKEILDILRKYQTKRQNIIYILKEIQNNYADKEIKLKKE